MLPAALLIAITIFLLHLAAALAAHYQYRKTGEEAALEESVLATRVAISRLSQTTDFVQRSKLQRRLVLEEKRLALMRGEGDHWARDGSRVAPARGTDVAQLLSRRALPLLCAGAVLLWWGAPMAQLPDTLLWPLGWALAGQGAVGAAAWCAACSTVAARLVALLPLRTTRRGEEGVLGSLSSLLGLLKQD